MVHRGLSAHTRLVPNSDLQARFCFVGWNLQHGMLVYAPTSRAALLLLVDLVVVAARLRLVCSRRPPYLVLSVGLAPPAHY